MNQNSAKILIIERNVELANLWRDYLERKGYDVAMFIDGVTEIDAVQRWGLPDLIVSGIDFDGNFMSGADFCSQIYQTAGGERFVPVIQLSNAYLTEEKLAEARNPSFSLSRKPVKPSELLREARKAHTQALKHEYQKTRATIMTAELAGNAILGVFNFIQDGAKSGVIVVESPCGDATISFNGGVPVNARCGELIGDEAIYELISWSRGQATFFSGAADGDANIATDSIAELLSNAKDQSRLVLEAETEFSYPDVQILKTETPYAQNPENPDADRLYEALSRDMTLRELTALSSDIPYRRIMMALRQLRSSGHIRASGKAGKAQGLSEDFRSEMLQGLKDQDISFQIIHPKKVGVFAAAPSLAMRFIGALCEKELASSAIMRYMNLMLLFHDMPRANNPMAFFDMAAVVVLIDPSKHESAAETRDFLALLRNSPVNRYRVAYIKHPEMAEAEKALSVFITDFDRAKLTPMDSLHKSCCLDVAAALLGAE